MFTILLAAYLTWLCGQRALVIWRMNPIDLVAWGILGSWLLGAIASMAIILLEVF